MSNSREPETTEQDELTQSKIFKFWVPLAATWLMMATEGPLLAAIIARLPEPKFNLAAYGVAYSLALIVEAPIIMMMTASVALVKNRQGYVKLRNFLHLMNGSITAIMLIMLIPPVFDFIAMDLVGLPPNVAALTHTAVFLLLAWPGSIGYRRFYQGILISRNLTKRVAYGTVLRVATILTVSFALYRFTDMPGSAVGALTLSCAVVVESIVTRLMAHSSVRSILQSREQEQETTAPLSYRSISSFYFPLAMTSLLGLGVQPMVTFFLGQSRMALESLAVLPVVTSLVFIFRSMGLSFQEVALTFHGERFEDYKKVRTFAWRLGTTVVVLLAIIAFTPLERFWYVTLSGLTEELAAIAHTPTMIMAIMPGLSVLLSFQRSILVNARRTRPITIATALEVTMIIATLVVAIIYMNAIGVYAAAAAFVIGRISSNSFLARRCATILRPYRKAEAPDTKAP